MRPLLALLSLGLGRGLAQTALPPDPHILSYPELRPSVQASADWPLLLSDSPETPTRSGLLYADVVNGRARLLAYHANGLSGPARLLVLAQALSSSARLTILRRGSATVSQPDPVIGQSLLLRYFLSRPQRGRGLALGQPALLYSSGPLPPGAVASVMLDLRVNVPVRLSVLMLGPEYRYGPIPDLPALPPDANHQRGTFPGAERRLTLPLGSRPARLTIGGPGDPALSGVDALTGQLQTLYGNFGLLYRLQFPGSAGATLAASPRGGLYQGAFMLAEGAGRVRALSVGRNAALTNPNAPEWLWRARGDLSLEFVPAGGSNLPLALVFYP